MVKTFSTQYLKLYNVLSCFLWLSVLIRAGLLWHISGDQRAVFNHTNVLVRWVQTLALAEVFHSILRFVKSSPFTTAIQVLSRLILVWGVCYLFPQSINTSPIYLFMILAWSITEVIRYAFYACNLAGSVPKLLLWLRYNTFLVLYPIGAGSELLLVLKTFRVAWNTFFLSKIVWTAATVIYPFGFYMLYTHMISQRRKVLKLTKKDVKA
ncbi:3-hydroxyacyl-CoA dehydratase involved in very long-chain fatty acid elongation Phs1 [Schizosaccharomyces osmophilus]|uniref:Very-long-chain (3R)-3-hydroxyacyl-CoA dehydratase n=1 Tax=Schizosaccharomyces osmophilus TaxID=2545709 RepID=A0AAF0AWB9_9SCHI|nr:3-hydroxyacyl-CoA dehydratase involved in very long-chain fatty acid elongation Phs1 [Schizosaccharomyces osmophilus]WBW72769.1 3-hydroxyacyl-CoA dehydratase involved in very long-chain fatty acid elongation Phs1 [Schizosaccharomyces osmophilus]